jgi:Asp-tRNA(Asn)/Glu-tRNA(Gln) amidotransferase A subunit family amidase
MTTADLFTVKRVLSGILLSAALVSCGSGVDSNPPQSQSPAPVNALRLVESSIAEQRSLLLSGQVSCVELVQGYIARIAAYDQSRGVNAITQINPRALVRARSLDSELDRLGEAGGTLPELFCAPLLIKDNYDTADMVTTGGSIALIDSLPPDDATVVRRLRESGAIVLAKTNMAEWAFSPRQSVSSSYGRTANAYDIGFVPAGSSGGTASGVAASFAVAGMGSDTGNSIRGPSSHLALVGIRPTLGLVSRDGIIPLVFDRDVVGPMARSVDDAVRLFNVIAGHDPADALSVPDRREGDYRDYLRSDGLQGKRLGVLRSLVNREGADSEIVALFEQALLDLADAGAVIVDPVAIEDFQRLSDEIPFCGRFRYDMYQYLQTLEEPPFLDVNTVLETGEIADESLDSFNFYAQYPLDVPPDDWEESCDTWPNHSQRNELLSNTQALMDSLELDALVYPSWANPPAPINDAVAQYRGDNNQLLVPDAGLPAITVPMGFWQGHLPAGVQFAGRPFAEATLIEIAYGYEQATQHRRAPTGYPELAQQ